MLGGLCFLGMLPCHIKLIGNKFVCISFVIGAPGKNLEKVKGKEVEGGGIFPSLQKALD